jgi:F0F1-type ATP synthase assembly protein I
MSAVYGIISYILIIGMLAGYVIVKRWGDKEEKKYNEFRDENQANNDTIRT